MKIHLIIVFCLANLIGFAQTVKFDTNQFPSLIEAGAIQINPGNADIAIQAWSAFKITNYLQEEATANSFPYSKLKFNSETNTILAYSENGFKVFDQNCKELASQIINQPGSDKKVTAADFDSDKIYYAQSTFDKFCETADWSILETNIKSGKTKTVTDINDEKFKESNSTETGKCPYISKLAVSPNGKSTAYNVSDIEFGNYCHNLFINSGKKTLNISTGCNETLAFLTFTENENLFYILQDTKAGIFKINLTNLSGQKIRQSNAYAKEGIRGEFLSISINQTAQTFSVVYKKSSEYKRAEYKLSGEQVEERTVKSNRDTDPISGNYFLAYDYNIYNLYEQNKAKSLGSITHDYDIFDIEFTPSNASFYSIDEAGTLKKWKLEASDKQLLILENTNSIQAIPTRLSFSEKETETLLQKTQADFKRYNDIELKKEFTRKSQEKDYEKMFKINDIQISSPENVDANKTIYAKFETEANKSVFDMKIYHIQKSPQNYTVVKYCGRCVNKFPFNTQTDNMLLAVLPDGKTAYLGIAEFKQLGQNTDESTQVVTVPLKTFEPADIEKILKEIFNN